MRRWVFGNEIVVTAVLRANSVPLFPLKFRFEISAFKLFPLRSGRQLSSSNALEVLQSDWPHRSPIKSHMRYIAPPPPNERRQQKKKGMKQNQIKNMAAKYKLTLQNDFVLPSSHVTIPRYTRISRVSHAAKCWSVWSLVGRLAQFISNGRENRKLLWPLTNDWGSQNEQSYSLLNFLKFIQIPSPSGEAKMKTTSPRPIVFISPSKILPCTSP